MRYGKERYFPFSHFKEFKMDFKRNSSWFLRSLKRDFEGGLGEIWLRFEKILPREFWRGDLNGVERWKDLLIC